MMFFLTHLRRIKMKRRCLGITLSLFVIGLGSTQAMADMLVWDLVASCPQGQKEVTLKMRFSTPGWPYYANGHIPDRLKESQALYACGGTCKAQALASAINWQKLSTECYCFPSGQKTEETTCSDRNDHYSKCATTVEARLPYDCDQLAHQKICVSPSCEDTGLSTYSGVDGAPCAELSPPAGAEQCLNEKGEIIPANEAQSTNGIIAAPEAGGCAVSPGAMHSSLLGLLFVVGGLSLLISRRRRG
jgi:hypothetical protein